MASLPPVLSAPGNPNAPGQHPLQIGPVIFNSLECPDKLPIGAGEQRTVVNELTGGSRVVQNFGPQPSPVSWTGNLWQTSLDARITALRQMMVSGAEVLLTWRTERYYCVVTKFDPGYRNASRAEYSITVEITRDANGAFSSTSAPSVDSQVGALMAGAAANNLTIASVDPIGAAALQPSLSDVQAAIQNVGPIAQAAGSTASDNLVANIETALAQVTTYLAGLGAFAPSYSAAAQLLNVLTLVKRNVQQGQSPASVRVQGGSLYETAVTAYGSIDQAFPLADFNGATSMRNPAAITTTLVLPPYPRAA
jgi:hypothetical protein